MAKQLKNIVDGESPPTGENSQATNETSQDLFLNFVGRQRDLDNQIKGLKKKKNLLRREMKNSGIQLAEMDLVLKMTEVENDEINLASAKAIKRYSEFMGLPIGTQMDFLDNIAEPDLKNTEELEKRAYASGRRSGGLGENQDENPYDEGSAQGQKWLEGYQFAQEKIAREMAPTEDAQLPEAA